MHDLAHPGDVRPHPTHISVVQRIGAGLSMMVFPVMLFVGFVSHPNIFSLEVGHEVIPWMAEWRGNLMFHFGHLLVMLSVPLIIFTTVRIMGVLQGRGAWYGLIGGVLAIVGAAMLAVDKGALTLTLTAFQDLPDAEFEAMVPAFQAMLDRAGWLWITWAYVALPIGTIIQILGLLREGLIPKWQGVSIIIGLALLMNPDIEIISTVGAFLMCVGLIPIGLREIICGLDKQNGIEA